MSKLIVFRGAVYREVVALQHAPSMPTPNIAVPESELDAKFYAIATQMVAKCGKNYPVRPWCVHHPETRTLLSAHKTLEDAFLNAMSWLERKHFTGIE